MRGVLWLTRQTNARKKGWRAGRKLALNRPLWQQPLRAHPRNPLTRIRAAALLGATNPAPATATPPRSLSLMAQSNSWHGLEQYVSGPKQQPERL